ncbi:MAG: hypothetical protein ACLGIB_00860 [Actinomycetota bacterium]
MQIARIVVAVTLFALTACTEAGLSKEEFIQQADAICREAEQRTEEIEPPRTPEALADFVDEAERITGGLLAELRELEPPQEGRETIDRLLEQIEAALATLPELKKAAEDRSPDRIQELGRELQQAASEANEIAQGYGLQVCGRTQPAPAS